MSRVFSRISSVRLPTLRASRAFTVAKFFSFFQSGFTLPGNYLQFRISLNTLYPFSILSASDTQSYQDQRFWAAQYRNCKVHRVTYRVIIRQNLLPVTGTEQNLLDQKGSSFRLAVIPCDDSNVPSADNTGFTRIIESAGGIYKNPPLTTTKQCVVRFSGTVSVPVVAGWTRAQWRMDDSTLTNNQTSTSATANPQSLQAAYLHILAQDTRYAFNATPDANYSLEVRLSSLLEYNDYRGPGSED